jgi:hypothetical protein
VNRYLAINIEGKIGQLTVIRTSSFIIMNRIHTNNLTNMGVRGMLDDAWLVHLNEYKSLRPLYESKNLIKNKAIFCKI